MNHDVLNMTAVNRTGRRWMFPKVKVKPSFNSKYRFRFEEEGVAIGILMIQPIALSDKISAIA
ncbi:hypothetical protein GCM10027287_44810 [Bordetella muralis]